jgi:hypothetical protein
MRHGLGLLLVILVELVSQLLLNFQYFACTI